MGNGRSLKSLEVRSFTCQEVGVAVRVGVCSGLVKVQVLSRMCTLGTPYHGKYYVVYITGTVQYIYDVYICFK